MLLGFEFLIDHGTDEVIEAEIVFLLTGFVCRSLWIGCAFELGLKTKAVLIEKGALLVGGRVGEFIGIDEGGGTLGCLAKMLKMNEFVALRRVLFVIAFALLEVRFDSALFGERAIRCVQMFLTCDEFVAGAIKGAGCFFDARGVMNLCHI